MPVITISREYGSGGKAIAQRVCEMLGYAYFDKTLMMRVAAEIGFSSEEVVDFSEDTYKMRGFVERLLERRRTVAELEELTVSGSSLRAEVLDEAQCINLVKDTLLAAYTHDNVVVVGRGGQAILREKHGVLHVRLNAPLGARALRVKERKGIELGAASDLVQRKDLATAAYLSRFFDIDWNNPLLYHLIVNTSKWELDDVAEMIVHALSHLKVVSSG
ncbi:MAG: cytidylate kinase-like family protein [Anaerolineae bacterium]|nr:cytidylate kinase-like family protein [Anaerolineae bacterium]